MQTTAVLAPRWRAWFSGVAAAEPAVRRAAVAVEEPDHGTFLAWRSGLRGPDDLVIMGPRTRARYYADRPGASCVKLRFRPGRAAAVLGSPVRGLADRIVPVSESVLASAGLDARAALLSSAGPAGSGEPTKARYADLVERAVAMLSVDGVAQRPSVRAVARELHVSERHLRTVFTDAVGLPPSSFTRIDRVRYIVSRLEHPLREVAAEAGYYDQSHMTADFRRVMGVPPGAFAADRWPALDQCVDGPAPG